MYWPIGVPQIFAHHAGNGNEDNSTGRDGNGQGVEGLNGTHIADTNSTAILDLKVPRTEQIFVTISKECLHVWSIRPVVLLVSLKRSRKSLSTYGHNVDVHLRPDGSLVVLRTSSSFLILYAIDTDTNTRVLQQRTEESQSRKQSLARTFGSSESSGLAEVVLRFRKTIKIDAGIRALIATDQDLIVATLKPPAAQCIRWETQKGLHQTATQLLSKTPWLDNKSTVAHLAHDRAMNLSVWLDAEGSAYAVRRIRPQAIRRTSSEESSQSSTASSITSASKLFDGYRFYSPAGLQDKARLASINARFSLIALATESGKVLCFAAKDYAGNIPLSHTFQLDATISVLRTVTTLLWSPDGYCLFAGFDVGWMTWSVFGKELSSTFKSNSAHVDNNDEKWLQAVQSAQWLSHGSELILTSPSDHRIWKIDFSRSAAVGSLSCANLVQALQQTPSELMVYRGHELPDLTSISGDAALWHHAQYPSSYLHNQWPIRVASASQDGRYVAVAGRRGLIHYSVTSGRWRTFSDFAIENSFAVRGGMCWFDHILAVATEHAQGYDLRLYSRDQELGRNALHNESFPMPIVFIGPSGEDSLLVYTYENILYHYIISFTTRGAQLLQLGQIAFHGVVRAPSRVRSVSWILPENQLRNVDPSKDVEHASVLFLIDDKLVLLYPSRNREDAVKYDMRVIAHQAEYYILMRDQMSFNFEELPSESLPPTPSPGSIFGFTSHNIHYSLRDSLWIFSGETLCLWSDVQDLLQATASLDTTKQSLLTVPLDFYPLSIVLNKGVVLGIDSENLQRRDVNFAQLRTKIRSQLFLPYVLKYQLLDAADSSIAFALAHQYQHLTYFAHALEILLHIVLDHEADRRRQESGLTGQPEPLPAVLSFLQMALSSEAYLSTIVQCIRKTEFSFWQYLFAHLPAPELMFEQALALSDLKTASGYLIVMQTFEEEQESPTSPREGIANKNRFEDQVVRLMVLSKESNDFELCSNLARFMIGIDPRGDTLRRVVQKAGFRGSGVYLQPERARLSMRNIALQDQQTQPKPYNLGKLDMRLTRLLAEEPKSAGADSIGGMSRSSAGDYFSARPGDIS